MNYEQIQNELIKRNKYEVVESFIAYRKERERIRMEETDLIKQINEKKMISTSIVGVDGDYVNRKYLQINLDEFFTRDLCKKLGKR